MTIRINGTLIVKEIKGASGRFCVGDLICSLGEFKVKEPILDQFEEGKYQGDFLIERFYLNSYVWRGKSTTDIRAKVMEVFLDTAEEGKVEEVQTEPDPISTEPASVSGDAPVQAVVVSVVAPDDGVVLNPECQDLLNTFGVELGSQVFDGKEVKLDPTVDRALFRIQRDKLKAIGYAFDAKSQAWQMKKEAGDE